MEKYQEIKERFEALADKDEAVRMSAYMRNLFEFYGLPTRKRRTVYKELIKAEKRDGAVDWGFLDQCYADNHREFQYLVLDYLTALDKLLCYEDIPKIKQYIKAKQWWDTIDGLDEVIGAIGLRDSRVDELMLEWSMEDDIWVRRIAIDHQLIRKDKTNAELLGKIICNNFGSKEFFINKAIGWSLRDYSKTNPDWVRAFIDEHRMDMDKLSISEASKYL